jgi:hypothetical protein
MGVTISFGRELGVLRAEALSRSLQDGIWMKSCASCGGDAPNGRVFGQSVWRTSSVFEVFLSLIIKRPEQLNACENSGCEIHLGQVDSVKIGTMVNT